MHHSSCQSGNKSSEGLKPKSFRPKRRHSFFALLLAAALFVGLLPTVSLPITAASPAADFEFDESIGMITKYTGSATNVVIPETINGVTVTAIGMEAFAGCSWLTSVSIPNSVVTIGGATFSGCSSLTSVAIPDSVTAIGVAAFAGCSSLTSVTIPEHVTEIRYAAFSRCSSLVEIRVAENNPAYCSVDGVLFSKDQKMICSYPAGRSQKNYAIPAGVSDICYEAFAGCSALTSITIPEGVTGIEYQAFAGCLSLTSVTIPESVTAIGGGVFYSCSSLSEIRVAENNPAYCSVDGVLFSKDQKTIYTYPAGRSEKNYVIPNSVQYIAAWAFQGCSSLTGVTIPNGVAEIGNGVFSDCSSLAEIRVEESNPAYCSVGGVLFSKDQTTIYSYPAGRTSKSYTIPDSVQYIAAFAFQGCSSLTSLTIPVRVKNIGYKAFSQCSSLTSLTIPDDVQSVADLAFSGCDALSSLHVQDSEGRILLSFLVSMNNLFFPGTGEKETDIQILYSGTREAWNSIPIGYGYLRDYLTARVVFISSEVFIWGDVDGNGKVETKDKVLISRYLAKWTMNGGFNQAAADFNKDGDVTSAEAVVLARYLAKWTNLPYPVGQLA